MRSILRDPGAEVTIGMASFAVSFLAVALALVGLRVMSWPAFVIAALFLLAAAYSFIALLRERRKTQGYVRQIGIYLRAGRVLRSELYKVHSQNEWTEEEQKKVPQWKAEVQRWLDDNLPDYTSEFDLEGFISTIRTNGLDSHAYTAAEQLESRMVNLREILRDIRR